MFPFLVAFLLGLKHSFDADHVVAVSTYLTRAQSLKKSFKLSINWALGHMITAGVITFILFLFKDIFLTQWLGYFESIVAIMLIIIGFLAFKDLRGLHSHKHVHDGVEHVHVHTHKGKNHDHNHILGVGIVHGLASNDELLLLLTISIGLSSFLGVFLGLIIFSVGVITGMMIFSFIVNLPVARFSNFRSYFVGGSGILSIVYGVLLLGGIA